MTSGMLGALGWPGAVTLLGLVLALAASASAMAGQVDGALVFLIFAGAADLLDGPLARRRPRDATARRFGVELDSIVDMASFGMAPVVIAVAAGLAGPLGFAAAAAYLCAAALRLAWFNVGTLAREEPLRRYTGLPVTYAALVLPLGFTLRDVLGRGAFRLLLAATLLALALLFVSRIPVPKPRGRELVWLALVGLSLAGYFGARAA